MNRVGRKQVKSVQKEDSRNYLLMPEADTYALGIHALRKACQKENNFVYVWALIFEHKPALYSDD